METIETNKPITGYRAYFNRVFRWIQTILENLERTHNQIFVLELLSLYLYLVNILAQTNWNKWLESFLSPSLRFKLGGRSSSTNIERYFSQHFCKSSKNFLISYTTRWSQFFFCDCKSLETYRLNENLNERFPVNFPQKKKNWEKKFLFGNDIEKKRGS